jgi:hypothetical protein
MALFRIQHYLPISFAMLISACAVNYDQTTDQQITSATQEGNKQIETWRSAIAEKKSLTYDDTAYGKIIGDLRSLKTRLTQSADFETQNLTPIVDSQIDLWNNIKTTQLIHKTMPDSYLKIQEDIFNYNMGLLTLYEAVLKSGGSTSGAGASVANAKSTGPTAAANVGH